MNCEGLLRAGTCFAPIRLEQALPILGDSLSLDLMYRVQTPSTVRLDEGPLAIGGIGWRR